MKDLKKYMTEGLLQFAILLSLVGVRVDLDSYLPPIREIILGTSSAYSQIPFHSLRDTWEGSSLHPKSPDLDAFFTARRLLGEVRALGDTRVPRTELSAWLVHTVSADAAESGAAGALLPTGSSEEGSGGTESPSHGEGPSQAPAGSSSLQPSHGSASQPGPGDCTKEKQEDKLGYSEEPYGYSYLHNDNGKTDLEEEVAQSGEEGDPSNTGASDSHDIGAEIDRNTTEPSLFFEEFIQLLAQTENALEGTSENSLQSVQPSSIPGNSVGELWQDFLSLPDLNIFNHVTCQTKHHNIVLY